MYDLYDNGTMLLGTKRDILSYTTRQFNAGVITKDEYDEIKETLEDLVDDTIVAINYDCGMGMTFDWWTRNDIIKEMS